MEVIPILSTVILVATIITLIVAIAAYVVFRVKDKRRGGGSAATAPMNPEEMSGNAPIMPGSVKAFVPAASPLAPIMPPAAQAPLNNAQAAPKRPPSQGGPTAERSEEEYSGEYFEDDAESAYEEEETEQEELTAAQAAFLHSMRSAISRDDKAKSSGPAASNGKSPKMRRFQIPKKEGEEPYDSNLKNDRSLWR